MKKTMFYFCILITIGSLAISGCKKDKKMKFGDTKLAVSFGVNSKSLSNTVLTKQTPAAYVVALHSAKILGHEGTPDYPLFSVTSLSDAEVYNFTGGSLQFNLMGGTAIPEGSYHAFEVGIYYLQMRLEIYTANRGIEWRNMRIYFCDDGVHRRGDVIQVADDGTKQGWLFGENQIPDFDPVTPRINAYTYQSDGINWYQFADKNGQNFGPFADLSYWNSQTQPFTQVVPFIFEDSDGETLIIDFNVHNCWQFEDKSGDGYWGGNDLYPDGAAWHMNFPTITLRLE